MLRRLRVIAPLVVATAVVAGCNSSSSGNNGSLTGGADVFAGVPSCSQIKVGAVIQPVLIDKGCRSGDTIEAFGYVTCGDGRKYVDFHNQLHGYVGGRWQAGAASGCPVP